MIIKEFFKTRNDGIQLYKTYSSENYKIKQKQTQNIYDEAIDVEGSNYTYIELEEKIEQEV